MTQSEAIRLVESEYAARRKRHEDERNARILEVHEKDGEIAVLQARLPDVLSRAMRKLVSSGPADRDGAQDSVRREIASIQAQIASRLQAAGFAPGYMDMRYDCPACRDVGYIGEARETRCACMTNRLAELQFDYERTSSEHRFDRFDASIYPSDNQRTQAENALAVCRRYADAFPASARRNILLLGTSGLGKTFLLDCIASRVAERGHSTISVTGFRMLEAMRNYHFGDPASFEQLLGTPLLLIDDLGTEPMLKNISIEYLFTLLNERMTTRKHTVIATNLTPSQLGDRYGERILSRMIDQSTTDVLRLTGHDLRFLPHGR